MPLNRPSPNLWSALPGVVAAYQPVMAPDPLLARYNMAHGGDNRYLATDGVAPTWVSRTGWRFSRASATCLNTGIICAPSGKNTILIQYKNLAWWWEWLFGEKESGASTVVGIYNDSNTSALYYYNCVDSGGRKASLSGGATSGNIGVAGSYGYFNGRVDSAVMSPSGIARTAGLQLGKNIALGEPSTYNALAVAIYARVLAAAEVWSAAHQMAYCDVNPDWSVWARQRQWYYGSQVASVFRRRTPDGGRVGSRGVSA